MVRVVVVRRKSAAPEDFNDTDVVLTFGTLPELAQRNLAQCQPAVTVLLLVIYGGHGE